jgi:hypothetical protein
MPLQSFDTVGAAKAALAPDQVIWCRERNASGGRYFITGLPQEHLAEYLASKDKLGDEYIFKHREARLFFDIEDSAVSAATMAAVCFELVGHVRALLEKHYGLKDVYLTELDCSRAGKQSRHLIFDVVFADVGQMHGFVLEVLAHCTPSGTKNLAGVDTGVYRRAAGGLRLPLSRKWDAAQGRALPVGNLLIKRALVASFLEGAPRVAHEPAPDKRQRGGVVDSVPAQNLVEWLAPWSPKTIDFDTKTGTFRCIVSGRICPHKLRPHTKNNTYFNAKISPLGLVYDAYYTCSDADDCLRTRWPENTDLTPVCFPMEVPTDF